MPQQLKRLWVLALLTVGGACAAAQLPARWHWSNPAPHGGNVVDMAYSPALLLGVQVAERGQIYTSDDLDLWLPRDSNVTNAMRAVTFFGSRIVITGENGAVLWADDVSNFKPGTLVSGPTSDWLEAVCASPSLLVAAGDNGAIYASTNGVHWTRQSTTLTTWFRGAAWGGGTFVVVGENGEVYTSQNGSSWTRRTSPTNKHLNRVQYANSRFCAVGDAGVVLSSVNGGTNWFLEVTGATNTLQYHSTTGSNRLVTGTHEVRLQQQGTIWLDQLAMSNGPPNWSYLSAIGQPAFFLIAGQTGLQSEGYQVGAQPYYWLTPYDSVRSWLWDAIRMPGFYVAVGDYGTVMTSGNGVDWTLELVPTNAMNKTLLGVGGTTNLLLAVGENGSIIHSFNALTNILVTNEFGLVVTQTVSTLGVVWNSQSPATSQDLQGVAVLSNSLYVVTGEGGTILVSATGTNWLARPSGTTSLLSSVTAWPGGLVATGDDGAVVTSTNGLIWKARPPDTTNWLYRVRWLNGTLIAVGQNGTILTSSNAVAWTKRATNITAWLNDVAYVDGTWFVVGAGGTVLTSTNLVTWTNQGTLTKKALFAAATDTRQLVSVGVEGVALRSQVVPDTTPVGFLNCAFTTTNRTAYSIFLFGGKPDQKFTLERCTNLLQQTWFSSPVFEILDGSGTLYYFETSTFTNQPAVQFYRTRLVL